MHRHFRETPVVCLAVLILSITAACSQTVVLKSGHADRADEHNMSKVSQRKTGHDQESNASHFLILGSQKDNLALYSAADKAAKNYQRYFGVPAPKGFVTLTELAAIFLCLAT